MLIFPHSLITHLFLIAKSVTIALPLTTVNHQYLQEMFDQILKAWNFSSSIDKLISHPKKKPKEMDTDIMDSAMSSTTDGSCASNNIDGAGLGNIPSGFCPPRSRVQTASGVPGTPVANSRVSVTSSVPDTLVSGAPIGPHGLNAGPNSRVTSDASPSDLINFGVPEVSSQCMLDRSKLYQVCNHVLRARTNLIAVLCLTYLGNIAKSTSAP